MDNSEMADALDAVAAFTLDAPGLTARIRSFESALEGIDRELARDLVHAAGIGHELLEGALIVKGLAGQINTVIHAVGILRALPYVLTSGERVISTSLGAGNTGRDWDLETDRQIAEFKFISWKGGAEAIRQNSLFIDVFHLAEAETERRRVMYVTGDDIPRRFLSTSRRALGSVLSKDARTATDFERRHGNRYTTVCDYWASVRDRVELVDLADVMLWPSGITSGLEAVDPGGVAGTPDS